MSRKRGGAPFSLFAFQDAITSVCGVVVLITLILALNLTRRVALEDPPETAEIVQRTEELRLKIENVKKELDDLEDSFRDVSDDFEFDISATDAKRELESSKERLDAARAERERLREKREKERDALEKISNAERENERLKEELKQAEEKAKAAKESANGSLDPNSVYFAFPDDVSEKPWFVDLSENKIVVSPSTQNEEKREFANTSEFMTWAKTRSKKDEYFVLIARPSGAGAFDVLSLELERDGYKIGIDLVGENFKLEFVPPKKKGTEE